MMVCYTTCPNAFNDMRVVCCQMYAISLLHIIHYNQFAYDGGVCCITRLEQYKIPQQGQNIHTEKAKDHESL